jgi:hypothetical protein
MKAIDRAKKHFLSQTAWEVQVPEWADEQGKPLSIWFNPLTVKDRDDLIKLQKRYGDGLETVVRLLIMHARDDQGRPLFTLEDKHDLMNNTDPNVIAAITMQLIENMDPEAIKKKSSPMDFSDLN